MIRQITVAALAILLVAASTAPVSAESACQPKLDDPYGLFARARDIRREINLHNLYNGLHLTVDQMETLLGLVREAAALRRSCFTASNYRATQILGVYEDIHRYVSRGERIPKSLEGMGGLMELAEKRVHKRFFQGMAKLEARAWAVLTPAQQEVFRTYEPCLVPPESLKNPVRVGQANTYEAERQILELARKLPVESFEREIAKTLSAALGHLERFLGKMDGARKKAELARMTAVCRKARKMSKMDFALAVDDLARELALHRQKDHFKKKAEEFLALVKKYAGGHIGPMSHHFLDPILEPILISRIERAKNAPEAAPRDLEGESGPGACPDGRCGSDPSKDSPGYKQKYTVGELARILGLDGPTAAAFRKSVAKAKEAHMKVLQLPMQGGGTPLDRILKIQTLHPAKRQAAVQDLFARLSDPIPGRDASHMEYILWIKIGLDRRFKKLLTPAQYEKLVGRVEDTLEHIDLDGEKNKITLEQLAARLGLGSEEKGAARLCLRAGQTRAWKLLSTPNGDGVKPLDLLLKAQTLPPAKRQAGIQRFVDALSTEVPGREATYGEEIEAIKAELEARLRSILSESQYNALRAMKIDLLDVKLD